MPQSSMIHWQTSPLPFSLFWCPMNDYQRFWNAEHPHVFSVYAPLGRDHCNAPLVQEQSNLIEEGHLDKTCAL